MNLQVAAAKAIATIAHKGQKDKLGADYIGHPARVAKMLVDKNAEPAAIAAAWLHDVIEDCADIFHGEPRFGITAKDLLNAGVFDKRWWTLSSSSPVRRGRRAMPTMRPSGRIPLPWR